LVPEAYIPSFGQTNDIGFGLQNHKANPKRKWVENGIIQKGKKERLIGRLS
jgi:hypothetical protein